MGCHTPGYWGCSWRSWDVMEGLWNTGLADRFQVSLNHELLWFYELSLRHFEFVYQVCSKTLQPYSCGWWQWIALSPKNSNCWPHGAQPDWVSSAIIWMHVWILMVFILILFFPKFAHPGPNSESLFSPGTHSPVPLGLRKTALVAQCQLFIWRMSKKRWAISHRGLCDCVRGPRKLANI